MFWMLLAIISIITTSVASLLERILMKDEDSNPISYAIIFQFLLALFSCIFAVMFGKFTLPNLSVIIIIRFVLSAILWAGSTVFSFQAIKRLTAGEVTVLTSTGSIVSMALGIIFLREIMKMPTLIGACLVLFSIWIINSGKLSFNSKKGIAFALMSALCAGIAVVNDVFILKSYEAFSYTAIISFLPGVILIIGFPKEMTKIRKLLKPRLVRLMSTFCLFYSIQAITYYLALQNGAPVSQLSPLTKSSIVLTVLLGAIFLGERKELFKKIIAALVVTVGCLLLS